MQRVSPKTQLVLEEGLSNAPHSESEPILRLPPQTCLLALFINASPSHTHRQVAGLLMTGRVTLITRTQGSPWEPDQVLHGDLQPVRP